MNTALSHTRSPIIATACSHQVPTFSSHAHVQSTGIMNSLHALHLLQSNLGQGAGQASTILFYVQSGDLAILQHC